MTVQQVELEKIRPLRHMVLRPGQPIESTDYDMDKDELTLHYATFSDDTIVTIATFYPQEMLEITSSNAYRLRGMATHPDYRRKGFAQKLMLKALQDLEHKKCDLLWCKARLVAVEFYASLGFEKKGAIFEIQGIGPHYLMFKKL